MNPSRLPILYMNFIFISSLYYRICRTDFTIYIYSHISEAISLQLELLIIYLIFSFHNLTIRIQSPTYRRFP